MGVTAYKKTVRQQRVGAGIIYTNTRRGYHSVGGILPTILHNTNGRLLQTKAIVQPGIDAHGFGHTAGATGEAGVMAFFLPTQQHRFNALNGLYCPNEHRERLLRRATNNIKHVVQTITQIHVSYPTRSKHGTGAVGKPTAKCMARSV